jgi:hypothetical protein
MTSAPPDSLQLDGFVLKTITISDDILTIGVTHGGGCKEHAYAVFMSPAVFLESFPAQANLYLQHNANGDRCKALLYPKLCFDLRPIAEQYQKFYQRLDPIQINVFGYSESQPGLKFSAFYLPR